MLRNTLLLALGCLLLANSLQAEELISWRADLDEARQVSQQYKVPMLIHFYGDHCMPCKSLESNVFTRPEVASTMQRYFVPVRINATQDRRAAAEYGVHSWPTDVFVGPDGKVLTQGVCNQNANAYLQNLQSVAVMNRDRNAMLAGASLPSAAPAAGSAYGRTSSANLQQSAPGRDQAPSPYSNPSSGATPYADRSSTSGLAGIGQSSLPSPTLAGQSTHAVATTGQVGSGPLPSGRTPTVHPSESSLSLAHKEANLPKSVQWQTGAPGSTNLTNAPTVSTTARPFDTRQLNTNTNRATLAPARDSVVENPHFAATDAAIQPASAREVNADETLSNATKGPAGQLVSTAQARGPRSNTSNQNGDSVPMTNAPASNASMPMMTLPGAAPVAASIALPGIALPSGPLPSAVAAGGHPTSGPSEGGRAMPVVESPSVKSPSATTSAPEASVPSLSGYCPIGLFVDGQWIEGKPEFAVRHRGRIYLLSSASAVQKFLAAPDRCTPVLSGYDPLIFISQGRLVEGSVYDGLKDPKHNQILLFATPENKKFFQENYDRLAAELAVILSPAPTAGPMTATSPSRPVIR